MREHKRGDCGAISSDSVMHMCGDEVIVRGLQLARRGIVPHLLISLE